MGLAVMDRALEVRRPDEMVGVTEEPENVTLDIETSRGNVTKEFTPAEARLVGYSLWRLGNEMMEE